MSLFSSLSTLFSVAMDSSSAAMAAKEKVEQGGTVRQVLETFARETNNQIDDRVVEELSDWAEVLVDSTRIAAVYALRVAARSEEYLPKAADGLRRVADTIEIQGPELASFARAFSSKAAELADILESQGGPVADSDNSTGE